MFCSVCLCICLTFFACTCTLVTIQMPSVPLHIAKPAPPLGTYACFLLSAAVSPSISARSRVVLCTRVLFTGCRDSEETTNVQRIFVPGGWVLGGGSCPVAGGGNLATASAENSAFWHKDSLDVCSFPRISATLMLTTLWELLQKPLGRRTLLEEPVLTPAPTQLQAFAQVIYCP